MSAAPPPKPLQPKQKEKEKDRERELKERERNPQVSERLKTIVRRLPPNLPEEVFWQSVQPWVSDETVNWKIYYPGKPRKRLNKENILSRAYIAFKDEEQLTRFSREYDGHIFRDKAGVESMAIVEFAPYQKIPADKKRLDARNATIEKDEDYISFVESLNAVSNAEPVAMEALIASTQLAPQPTTTPLLEALKAEKTAQKDKDAILRNHAHYKDGAPSGPSRKGPQDTGKQKAAPKQPEPKGPKMSKKAIALQKAAAAQALAAKAAHAAAVGSSPQGKKGPPPVKIASNAKPGEVVARNSETAPRSSPSASPATTARELPVSSSGSCPGTNPPSSVPEPPTAPRRGRPVLGLASRQFEAALSGAGVGGTNRNRSRREREKEKEAKVTDGESGVAEIGIIGGGGGVDDSETNPIGPGQSPSKGGRAGGRRKIGVPSSSFNQVTDQALGVPTVLQISDSVASMPPTSESAVAGEAKTPANVGVSERGRGGGSRRSRGRGRGGSDRGGG